MFHIVDWFLRGRPLAMGPCGSFLGTLMKLAECAWGTGAPPSMMLTRSTMVASWASAS